MAEGGQGAEGTSSRKLEGGDDIVEAESAVFGALKPVALYGEDKGRGPIWCLIPLEFKILDRCCCISFEKSSFDWSKKPAREIGRTVLRRAIFFQSAFGSTVGKRLLLSLLFFFSEGLKSKVPFPPTPALCTRIFSISSVSQAMVSFSISSG